MYVGSTLRSMEEVLTSSGGLLTGWLVLLAQLLLTSLVAVFIIRRARLELDRALGGRNIAGTSVCIASQFWQVHTDVDACLVERESLGAVQCQ